MIRTVWKPLVQRLGNWSSWSDLCWYSLWTQPALARRAVVGPFRSVVRSLFHFYHMQRPALKILNTITTAVQYVRIKCQLPWSRARTSYQGMTYLCRAAILAGCPSCRHRCLIRVPVRTESRLAGHKFATLTTESSLLLRSRTKHHKLMCTVTVSLKTSRLDWI